MRLGSLVVVAVAALLVACGGAQARKNGYITKGREYLAAHNFEKARLEFRNALQLDPNDAEAAYLAGRATERTGNVREAAGLYQDAIQSNDKHAAARAALARLYVFAGAPQKAIELANTGLAAAPDDPGLLVARAAARVRMEDLAGARADAESAVRAAPADENAIALLASIYSQSGDTNHAIEVLGKAVQAPAATPDLRAVLAQLYLKADRRGEAIAELKRVIALDPGKYIYRYQLAQMYQLDKNSAGAEAALRAAVKDLPQSTEAEFALIKFLEESRPLGVAEAELARVVAARPNDFRYRLRLGEFYVTHDRLAQAEVVDRKIIEDDSTGPNGLAARNQLARAYIANHRSALAVPLIEETLKQNPRDNDALTIRAGLALARGDANAAITDLRAVQQDQPNSTPIQRSLARAYLRNNDPTLAEETLRATMQRVPDDTAVQLDLAQLLARSGRLDAAVPILVKVTAEKPDDLTATEALFDVHMARKDFASARALALALETSKPDLPIGFFMSGTVELRDNHLDAARTAYERASAIAPTAVEPVTALVRLDLAQAHPDHALALLDKRIQLQPKEAVLRSLKGEVLAGLKRSDAAIASWREASALAPRWPSPWRNIAIAQFRSGARDAAAQTLNQGIEATGRAPELIKELAALYEKTGRSDDAKKTLASLDSEVARAP